MESQSSPLVLIAVMGPTASGKTALAEGLAETLDAQLVNADAFQSYQGLDIGTAKPTNKDRYSLLDIKTPDETYGVGEFVSRAARVLNETYLAGRNAVVVGGTGLYIRALFEEYADMGVAPNPELREALNSRLEHEGLVPLATELTTRWPEVAVKTDLRNPVRVIRAIERCSTEHRMLQIKLPAYRKLKLGLSPSIEQLAPAIEHRAQLMVQNGWVQEVENLMDAGYSSDAPGLRAIGYRHLWDYLEGRVEFGQAIAKTIADTKRYAKRQRTWLRTEPNLFVVWGNEPLNSAIERVQIALK